MAGHVDYHALLVMGAAISDMHYTGMGAMEVHDDASGAQRVDPPRGREGT